MRAVSALVSAAARAARRGSRRASAVVVAVVLLGSASDAAAESLLEEGRQVVRMSATGNLAQSCFARDLSSNPAVDFRPVTVPGASLVRARLAGKTSDDWDLAVLERDSGRVIAASAQSGSNEVAEGFVVDETDAIVQACRRSGDGDAELSVGQIPLQAPAKLPVPKLVRVETPTHAEKTRLQALRLDLTEHGGEDFVAVVTYGDEDLAILGANGFSYEVVVPDLVQAAIEDRAADREFSRAVRSSAATSEIPSARTTYRRLADYQEELKQLAEDNSDLVTPVTLPHETWEGRQVEGIEITTDPENLQDGKPVYLQMGLHHAREWPSGEHVMEYARELIDGYRSGDERIVELVEGTRTILVPVINPDGFNVSREAGQVLAAGGGRHAESEEEMYVQIIGIAYEYWRKNCRLLSTDLEVPCLAQQPSSGLAHSGVDPNRNYGGLWGGPGSSSNPVVQSYRGPGPFSEPETRNVQDLVSSRQVTTLITNHTFSNLWLRPPGQAAAPDSPDEELYRSLGEEIVAHNGYSNIRGYELYDTTGTTEDWSYWSTGGLGYTPEIGCTEKGGNECIYGDFHGPYENQVVTEYDGGNEFAPEGGGNREAFLIAHENTLNPERHSLIAGKAPVDAVLRVQKTFETETWEGEHGSFEDHLESSMTVSRSGKFEFHVNPSTRPIVMQAAAGREATGEPSPPVEFSGDATTARPCASYATENPACFNDHAFEVPPNGDGVDNAKVTVRIEWPTPASDWDLRVFRDSDGDGSSVGETEVAPSGQALTNFEEASFAEPNLEPGAYVARVINWVAAEPYEGHISFAGPPEPGEAQREAWTLTCERDGEVITSAQVFVDRGERESLDLRRSCGERGGGNRPETPRSPIAGAPEKPHK